MVKSELPTPTPAYRFISDVDCPSRHLPMRPRFDSVREGLAQRFERVLWSTLKMAGREERRFIIFLGAL